MPLRKPKKKTKRKKIKQRTKNKKKKIKSNKLPKGLKNHRVGNNVPTSVLKDMFSKIKSIVPASEEIKRNTKKITNIPIKIYGGRKKYEDIVLKYRIDNKEFIVDFKLNNFVKKIKEKLIIFIDKYGEKHNCKKEFAKDWNESIIEILNIDYRGDLENYIDAEEYNLPNNSREPNGILYTKEIWSLYTCYTIIYDRVCNPNKYDNRKTNLYKPFYIRRITNNKLKNMTVLSFDKLYDILMEFDLIDFENEGY